MTNWRRRAVVIGSLTLALLVLFLCAWSAMSWLTIGHNAGSTARALGMALGYAIWPFTWPGVLLAALLPFEIPGGIAYMTVWLWCSLVWALVLRGIWSGIQALRRRRLGT